MLIITGNGRLTRDPELRHTTSGKAVTTIPVASNRRDRNNEPVYVDLVLWETQATAAAEYLQKGQSVTFTGRLDPRPYTTGAGEQRIALEVTQVDLEYGPRPRAADEAS